MGINKTDAFLKPILSIVNETIPDESLLKARLSLLDYLGVVFFGAKLQGDKIERLSNYLDSIGEDGLIIGMHKKGSLQFSIFANGLNSHYLELDDGCRFGVTHPGAPLFSALLPVAKKYDIGWERFLLGVLTGYETIVRISYAIQPSHYSLGYHPTATCDPLGIAVGLGVMLDMDFNQIKDAFSCACISAGGSLKAIEDISKFKVFNAGRAAELGYVSTAMALSGFNGPSDVLSGSTGFLEMMSRNLDYDQINDRLYRKPSSTLSIGKTYCKLYSSCRHTHGAIECILDIRRNYIFNPEDVGSIVIKIYKGVKGKHDIYDIVSGESAKMSIPYSAAVALYKGNADYDVFQEPNIYDASILGLKDKVVIIEDEELTSLLPHQRSTKVEIELKDGTKYSSYVKFPKGEPENPVDFEGMKAKFVKLSQMSGKSDSETNAIIKEIIFGEGDMNPLFKLI